MNKYLAPIVALLLVCAAPVLAETPRHPDELSIEPLEMQLQEADRDSLAFGVPVYLFENHDLPLLNVAAYFRMGSRYLAVENFAAVRLFDKTWRDGGTLSLPPDSLDRVLSAKSIQLSAWVGSSSGGVRASFVKEDLEDAVRLFADLILHPRFDADRLERAKSKRIKELLEINDNPWEIAERRFSWLTAGRDFPGNYLESKSEIEAVDPAALHRLRDRFVHPANAIIGVSGDFDRSEILALLADALDEWRNAPAFARLEKPEWTAHSQPGVYLLPGDWAQSHVRVGRRLPELTMMSPDYPAAKIQNYALGYGRVFMRTRGKGLSYGTAVFLSVGNESSTVKLFGNCRAEATLQLLETAIGEVTGLAADPLSEFEVETAKNFFVNSMVSNNERVSNIVSSKLDDLIHGRPEDFQLSYFNGLKNANAEAVNRCGREYADFNDSLVVLVLGNPEQFDLPLDSLGLGPVMELEPVSFGE